MPTPVGGEVAVPPFDSATALEQLRAELEPEAPGQESWPALAAALGSLPLALHLAAGHCVQIIGRGFLRRLRAKNLALTSATGRSDLPGAQPRALSDTFRLSLDACAERAERRASNGSRVLGAGHAPATGFGESLGAAISGLSTEIFEDMALAAPGCPCSTGCRAERALPSAYIRSWPNCSPPHRQRRGPDPDDRLVCRAPARARRGPGAKVAGNPRGDRRPDRVASAGPADPPGAGRAAGSRYATRVGPSRMGDVLRSDARRGRDRGRTFKYPLDFRAGRHGGGAPDRALTAAEEKRGQDRNRGADREAALAPDLSPTFCRPAANSTRR